MKKIMFLILAIFWLISSATAICNRYSDVNNALVYDPTNGAIELCQPQDINLAVESANQTISQLQTQNTQLGQDNNSLSSKVSDLNKSVSTYVETITKQANQAIETAQKLSEANEKVASVQKERDSAKEQLAAAGIELATERTRATIFEADKKTLTDQVATIFSGMVESLKSIQKNQDESEATTTEIKGNQFYTLLGLGILGVGIMALLALNWLQGRNKNPLTYNPPAPTPFNPPQQKPKPRTPQPGEEPPFEEWIEPEYDRPVHNKKFGMAINTMKPARNLEEAKNLVDELWESVQRNGEADEEIETLKKQAKKRETKTKEKRPRTMEEIEQKVNELTQGEGTS
ncbi:MAG: hypothetical protein UX13_C0024G0014 [Candidatus Woesebacteria bacterium GW2011_GWB1_45_5]|uniref:Uncharacterized protein n=1 Tax=Candidatus Woesebacteria bacterium GW2011_GWB1_45_5 TaxID=1618581 RepID=A0A0G1MPF3_9BACT|nr:MAG: hypothetical protein UX13_C0024G0014 [Candidatus Woesebacteria bacterium GW2011_GWB1_45_5]